MSGYPLPALSIRPAQAESPLDAYARIQQLRGQAQQQQLGAEQLKGAQLSNQSAQMDFDDQQKWRKAFMDAQGDPDKTLDLASKAGVSPKSVLGYKTTLLEQRQKLATLSKDQLANAKAQAELIGNHAQAALSVPPEQRPQAVQASLADLVQQGVMDPQTAQQAFSAYQQQGDGWLKLHATAAMSSKDQIDAVIAAQKRADDAAAAKAKLPGEIAESKSKQLALAGTNAQGMTAAQQGQQRMEQARLNEQKRHDQVNEGMGLPDGGVATGQASIDKVPPMLRGQVQSILDYRQAMPPQGRNNPINRALQYWVNAIDPTYEGTAFPARNKMMQSYTSGKEAVQINAVNTAMGHVGVLGDAIDALNNGNVKVLNALANNLGVQVGQTPQATFQTIVHRVGPELTAAYVQGGGGEGERGTTAADFDPSLAPQILKSNTAITARLLRSKIASLENQWKNTMKKDDFEQRFIMPEAQAALDKYAPKAGASSGITVTDPRGTVHTFPNQAAADAFKKAANIQ